MSDRQWNHSIYSHAYNQTINSINSSTTTDAIVVNENGTLEQVPIIYITIDFNKIKTDIFNKDFIEHLNV